MTQAKAAIICPSDRGGHPEHAANLAAAMANTGVAVDLLTGKGFRSYIGDDVLVAIRVREILLPSNGPNVLPRRLWSTIRLIQNNLTAYLFLLLNRNKYSTVIVEETRIPLALLAPIRRVTKLIVHNVSLHNSHDSSLWARLQRASHRFMIRRAARVIVHGESQKAKLLERYGRTATAISLPVGGYIEEAVSSKEQQADFSHNGFQQYAICIGELRRNKGYGTAIRAAAAAGMPLSIIGREAEPGVAAELHKMARLYGGGLVSVENRFLSREEFQNKLLAASVIVLPYKSFDAQSGVASRAMASNCLIFASDLPGLREQIANYPKAHFFEPGNELELQMLLNEKLPKHMRRDINTLNVKTAAAWKAMWAEAASQLLS